MIDTEINTLATMVNMREHYARIGDHLIAVSPFTGEEYSANPSDYWHQADDWTMTDGDGNPMELAVRVTRLVDPVDYA
jgi:hypothetical protein